MKSLRNKDVQILADQVFDWPVKHQRGGAIRANDRLCAIDDDHRVRQRVDDIGANDEVGNQALSGDHLGLAMSLGFHSAVRPSA
ncbi:MAG: hypothetical protein ACMVO3_12645 [Thalassobaculum sp.]